MACLSSAEANVDMPTEASADMVWARQAMESLGLITQLIPTQASHSWAQLTGSLQSSSAEADLGAPLVASAECGTKNSLS